MISETVQSMSRFQSEHSLFRLVFAKVREAIAIIQEGHICLCNPRFCSLSGYTEEEIVSMDMRAFMHPEEEERLCGYHRARLAGEAVPDVYECRGLSKTGNILWLEVSGSLLEWKGTPAALIFFTDISERKRAEKLLEMTMDVVSDGIWEYDFESGKYKYSDSLAHMLGYGQGEMKGEGWFCEENVHPEDAARFHAALKGYLEGSVPGYELAMRLRTRKGAYKWIYTRGKIAERDAAGRPLRLIGSHTDIHARRQALRDVRNLQDRLQGLVEHLSIGVAVYQVVDEGNDFVFVDFNKAAEHITCISRETVIGKSLFECFPATRNSALVAALREVWMTGESCHLPPFYYEGAFRQGWRENRIYRIPTGEVVALFEDVTERKRAEEALRASEHQKELILNATSEVVVYCGMDMRVIWSNRVASRQFGKPPDALIGLPCYTLWHQRETLCERCPVLQARDTKMPQECEIQTPDGRYWLVRGYPILDDQREVKGLAEFSQDITEARRAENALKYAREKIKFHVENSPLGVIEWGGDGRISSWSSRAETIFGWKATEVANKCWHEFPLIGEEDVVYVEGEIRQLCSGARDFNTIRNRNYDKDGREMYCVWYNSVLRDDAGKILSILSLVEDVTEQVMAQKEKARLEEQFHQVQKLESVGRLAGGVAHDLNNLLSPILGYGELLLRDSAAMDPRRDSLEQIVQAGMRARDLVRQLLAFSRKQTLEFKSLDVHALLKNFEKLLRHIIREDIVMRVIPPSSSSRIRGDVGQLEQVVMNLVVNAQDAMPDGGTLTIATDRTVVDAQHAVQGKDVTPGAYVVVTCTDTGCGMDETMLQHLFEPFFTTKEKDKGTGLGLSTVYGIVAQHEGTITVDSEPGRGTTFCIYLPVDAEEADNSMQVSPPVPAEGGGPETILLVEDNEQVRDLVFAILEREGYAVLKAESGKEALRLLEGYNGPLHMVLTDVVMPEMNGRELFTRVSGTHPQVSVLYMSGYTDDVVAPHAVMDPGCHFIQKPFGVNALAVKVREVLDA